MNERQAYLFLSALPLLMLITAFFVEEPALILSGIARIASARSLLLNDYLAVGGIGATLLNLASLVTIWETSTTVVIIAGLFGTTLAPIGGQFGPLAGIAAGFFHLSIVMNVGVLHGGINLYNNGFAGGFVASFLAPTLEAFTGEKKSV